GMWISCVDTSDLYHFVPVGDRFVARYPLTNAQYQRFLQAEDFAEKALWLDLPSFGSLAEGHPRRQARTWEAWAGWRWLQAALKKPEYAAVDGRVEPLFWRDPRLGIAHPDAPVVGVTWYEANAYCRWLSKHWEELEEARANQGLRPSEVRLLLESEWIASAGGGQPPERFPWDAPGKVTRDLEEIMRRANLRESGVERTSPVDRYPLGQSPLGVWDLAGNVWEWQANPAERETIALRGGSWLYDAGTARLVSGYVAPPHARWGDLGLRVAALH
ncbi:MAG TPA: SUMF1/EgtB/PvdO family nonheme iron enzyme, partial [Anaerolineaceae bacterium]|nr:SUMF1/EgtB/PvdO family nonheme iron enzyme [Anaerolineaceae bacterium]